MSINALTHESRLNLTVTVTSDATLDLTSASLKRCQSVVLCTLVHGRETCHSYHKITRAVDIDYWLLD